MACQNFTSGCELCFLSDYLKITLVRQCALLFGKMCQLPLFPLKATYIRNFILFVVSYKETLQDKYSQMLNDGLAERREEDDDDVE